MGSALYNMGLGAGAVIGPLLGGLLVSVGDKKYPDYIKNQAYDPSNLDSTEPEYIGNGFQWAANVMSMITLTVVVIYGLVGWIFRPKSDFEKMKE
jgi:MFS family permease